MICLTDFRCYKAYVVMNNIYMDEGEKKMKEEKWIGWIFLLLGLFWVGREMHWLSFSLSNTMIIGLFLLALYIKKGGRRYYGNLGLLLPGLILILSGLEKQSFFHGMIKSHGMVRFYQADFFNKNTIVGFAFLLVYILHTIHFNQKTIGERYWPLVVGMLLIGRQLPILRFGMISVAPLLLLGLGLFIIIRGMRGENKQNHQEFSDQPMDYRDQYPDN